MRVLKILIPGFCLAITLAAGRNPAAQEHPSGGQPMENQGVHSFTMKDIDGQDVPLSQYQGKALLIVNTASRCGFTPQYKPLQELYEKYQSRGFEVLAFPANNFMGQEPGTNAEIKNFCLLNYKTTFPVFAKTSVKGADINPLYNYLTTRSGFDGPIKWNFNKFLVDPAGRVTARFDSAVDPLSEELINSLEKILPGSLENP